MSFFSLDCSSTDLHCLRLVIHYCLKFFQKQNNFSKLQPIYESKGGGKKSDDTQILILLLFLFNSTTCKYNQLSISQRRSPSKLVISQSKFAGHRNFILRYHQSEIKGVSMQTGDVSKLYSLILKSTLRYQCLR